MEPATQNLAPEKRADSNSPSHSQFLSNNDFVMSVDRLTIVGDLVGDEEEIEMSELVKRHPRIEVLNSGYDRFSAKIGDHAFVEYDKKKGTAFDRRNFRLEFNPNKLETDEISGLFNHILDLVGAKSISRLDLAFDTSTINLSEYDMETSRPTKQTEIRGLNGALETKYLGARRSDRYIRLYDKKKELAQKHDIKLDIPQLWRLELELKNHKATDFSDCLKDLRLVKPDWKSIDSFVERAKVYMLLYEANEWTKLTKNTKTKYKKIIKELPTEDLGDSLRELLHKNESRLTEFLESFIA